MGSTLGIYFGNKIINLVELKGKKLTNNIQIPLSMLSPGELEEKVPEELKIVALLKDEMRRNKIEASQINATFAGKDFIVRNFDLPIIPAAELNNAAIFEAKKYLPFKAEDLVSDFQVKLDKPNKKNIVLFEAIKKETLDRYLSILSQLNIKVGSVDYSAFSVLNFLQLAGVSNKGIVAVVSADLEEDEDVNFTVTENGFPLFSRDVFLGSSGTGAGGLVEENKESVANLDKLKTEIRVSLDYYHRKFPGKKIDKIFYLVSKDYAADLSVFSKELEISEQFLDLSRYLSKAAPFSLSCIKAYGASLSGKVRTSLKINLLKVKETVKLPKEGLPAEELSSLFSGLRINPKTISLAVLICLIAFGIGFYQRIPVKKEIDTIISQRPAVSTANPEDTYENLAASHDNYINKIKTLNNLLKGQVFLTEALNVIPRVMPEGVWLNNLNFQSNQGRTILVLEGNAYLADSDAEFKAVNDLVSRLKTNSIFNKYFKSTRLISLNTEDTMISNKEKAMTKFQISCENISSQSGEY
jgi:hypothetical protein